MFLILYFFFFFFNDTATTEIYTLSLHDALPISLVADRHPDLCPRSLRPGLPGCRRRVSRPRERAGVRPRGGAGGGSRARPDERPGSRAPRARPFRRPSPAGVREDREDAKAVRVPGA